MVARILVTLLVGLTSLGILGAFLYGSFKVYRYFVYKIWKYSISESIDMIQRAAFTFERELATTHPEVKDLALKVSAASLLFESNRSAIVSLILPLVSMVSFIFGIFLALPFFAASAIAAANR